MATVDEQVATLGAVSLQLANILTQQVNRSDNHEEQLAELKRQTAYARRVWVWLCTQHGLPEDEDPKGPWDEGR